MARPLRIQFSGALYHITSRGNAQAPIFLVDKDRERFLAILEDAVEEFNWVCHAYCLMLNHYHLLIETPEGNLSSGMRQINGVYTQAFNRSHGRAGHLFQGRFKAFLVQKDNYLLELCRYIVLNPVRAGIVSSPDAWKWSSYRATAGIEKGGVFLDTGWILSQFGSARVLAGRAYARFVFSGIAIESPWKDLRGGIFLGNEAFVHEVKDLFKQQEEIGEIPRRQRYALRPSLSELFGEDPYDPETVMEAHTNYRYTLKEIGNYLGIHYSTVSRMVKRIKSLNSGKGSLLQRTRPDPDTRG
jgi:putative transposase